MRQPPQLCEIGTIFAHAKLRPGFYFNGIPYVLSKPCEQDAFDKAWIAGREAKKASRPNCAHHYKSPLDEVYAVAYNKEFADRTTDRHVLLTELNATFKGIPF